MRARVQQNEAAWNQGLALDARLTVDEWANRHRVLSSVAAAEPGQWSTNRTPYLKEIMEVLSTSDRTERAVFMRESLASLRGRSLAAQKWV